MRVTINYTNYPLSKELTEKSKRTATLCRPINGLILGILPGMAAAFIFSDSVAIPMTLMFAGMIGGPIGLTMLRKKKFAQYDAEYQKILAANRK